MQKIVLKIAFLSILIFGKSPIYAQSFVANFIDSPPTGRYTFSSWTPKVLADIFKGNTNNERVDIVGHLFLPTRTAVVPAVVLLHGSGGIYSAMLDYWPKLLNAAGYAVLAVDSFNPRGVASTGEDQSLVPFAADIADAFAALKLLSSHPKIDKNRIAIMGFSRGGTAVGRAAVEKIITAQRLPDDLRFAAHILAYSGGCAGAFRLVVKPGVFSKTPMLWIHGDKDDYTAIEPCQDYAQRIGNSGTPVEFLVIKGARHKFDSDDTKRVYVARGQKTLARCPIEIDINTLYSYNRFTGQLLSKEAYDSTLRDVCAGIGATVEGDKQYRDEAGRGVVSFLEKTFSQ
jgi:dienelactone hydrolase